jgi:hypothetical protein
MDEGLGCTRGFPRKPKTFLHGSWQAPLPGSSVPGSEQINSFLNSVLGCHSFLSGSLGTEGIATRFKLPWVCEVKCSNNCFLKAQVACQGLRGNPVSLSDPAHLGEAQDSWEPGLAQGDSASGPSSTLPTWKLEQFSRVVFSKSKTVEEGRIWCQTDRGLGFSSVTGCLTLRKPHDPFISWSPQELPTGPFSVQCDNVVDKLFRIMSVVWKWLLSGK